MNTFDCKDIILSNLNANKYDELDFNQKKILVCNELKNYLSSTLDKYYGFDNVCQKYNIDELINYLSDSVCILPLIKTLISIISKMQNSTIYWILFSDKKDVEINKTNNYIVSIYSGNNYSYIFNYLYNYYLNCFEENKTLKR